MKTIQRILLPLLLISAAFISCGRKGYTNASGMERPVKQDVFSYANRFTSVPKEIDTNAIYVHHCQFQTGGGTRLDYAYFRFFSGGQVLYVVSHEKLDFTNLDNLDKGMIGRYYFKNGKLRLQLFYIPGHFYSVSKFRGFFRGDSLFIRNTTNTPSPWCISGNMESILEKKFFKWEKQKVTFKPAQSPNW